MDKNFRMFRWCGTLALVTLLAGCAGVSDIASSPEKPVRSAQQESFLRSGHACCNLHYDGDAISDSNFAQLPFIPAGTPINVRKIDGHRVSLDINGRAMQMTLDHGRKQETIEQWLSKLVVADDPRGRLAGYPPAIRSAIESGRLMKGMTRDQVIMSVGYPQASDGRRLGASYWRYWWSSFAPFYVYWKGDKVSKIDGHSDTVASMTYTGK